MIIHENLPVHLDTQTKKLSILETAASEKNSRVTADIDLIETGDFNETTGAKVYEVKGRVFFYERPEEKK